MVRPAGASGDGGCGPVVTVIGSTNLSERSTYRDVEVSACLISTAASVRAQLQKEQTRLRAHARQAEVGEDGAEPKGGGVLQQGVARTAASWLRSFF